MKSIKEKSCLYDLLSLINENKFLTTKERRLLQKFMSEAKMAGHDILRNLGPFRQVNTLILPAEKEFLVDEYSLNQFWEPVILREKKNGHPEPKFFQDAFLGLFEGKILPSEKEREVDIYAFFRNSLTMKDLINEAKNASIENFFSPLATLSLGREIIMNGLAEGVSGTVLFFSTGLQNNFLSFLWIHRNNSACNGAVKCKF